MSKKFAKSVIEELQKIRYKLDNIENCEDGMEMIHIAQELSSDVESIEEIIEEKYNI